MRGFFGFLFSLILIGVVVSLGVGVYQAGIAQGIVDAGRYPAAAAVPVAGYGWQGPGFFGILFGIFFLFLIFGLIRAAFFRGGGGYGPGWGHHGWGPGWTRSPGSGGGGPEAWREERDRRIADLHRRLHEEGDGGQAGSGTSPGASGANAR